MLDLNKNNVFISCVKRDVHGLKKVLSIGLRDTKNFLLRY